MVSFMQQETQNVTIAFVYVCMCVHMCTIIDSYVDAVLTTNKVHLTVLGHVTLRFH